MYTKASAPKDFAFLGKRYINARLQSFFVARRVYKQ